VPDGTLQGRVSFPGQRSFIESSYTVVHGIQPGVVNVVIPATRPDQIQVELQGLPAVNSLEFTDGERKFKLHDCRISSMERVHEGDGIGYSVILYDRRWKWRFGFINGKYNQRNPNGKIIEHTRAKVHRMAELCLEAMGETKYDLGQLPDPDEDEALPQVDWDYANPAQALEHLVDQFGCRVVFRPIANNVLIARPGIGADLPAGTFEDKSPSREAQPKPEILRFVGAPAAFVAAIVLEAVGEDLDGTILPIDELSYAPKNGWGSSDAPSPPNFDHVRCSKEWLLKGRVDRDCVEQARKCIYRWYRPTVFPVKGEKFKVVDLDKFLDSLGKPMELFDGKQVVLLDRIVRADRDEEKKLFSEPSKCWGVYDVQQRIFNVSFYGNSTPSTPVNSKFTVDVNRGLIVFERLMRRINLGTENFAPQIVEPATLVGGVPLLTSLAVAPQCSAPAELVLLTSIHVLEPITLQPIRYTRDRKIPGGTKGLVQLIVRDDVQYAQWVDYKVGEWKVRREKNNRPEVDKAADYYLDGAMEFMDKVAETRTYPRLTLVDPDGAIQSVTWNCSGRVSTTVGRNTERVRWLPPFQVRKGQEKLRMLADEVGFFAGEALNMIPISGAFLG
jgi:hypothetical protein